MTLTPIGTPIPPGLDRVGIQGVVATPSDPEWDLARQAWNLAVDQRPLAVVFPDSASDVVRTVRWAAGAGAHIVTQGTGHGAASYETLEDAVLIRTTRLQGVSVDGTTCRVAAGTLWGDVAVATERHGKAALAGSSPDVGVVGYTLGGGIGWLGRRHGLACNRVTAVEMVTAAGDLIRVDPDHDPDAFWALRGGGGGFGVVTAVEFDLVDVTSVLAGTLAWDARHAPDLLEAWAGWTDGLDESTTSIVRILNLPDMPGVPEPFAGRRVVTLGAVAADGFPAAEAALGAMRRVAPPIVDEFEVTSPTALVRLHGDPEGPTPGLAHHALLTDFDSGAATAMVDVMGVGSDNPLVSLEVRHLGGALGREVDGSGALGHIDAGYVANAVGMVPDPSTAAEVYDLLGRTIGAFAPWDAGTYLNFVERAGESPFDARTRERLARVRAAHDPDGTFRPRLGLGGVR